MKNDLAIIRWHSCCEGRNLSPIFNVIPLVSIFLFFVQQFTATDVSFCHEFLGFYLSYPPPCLRYAYVLLFSCAVLLSLNFQEQHTVFPHDITAAMLSKNTETAATLLSQNNPVGVKLFSSNKFAWVLAT